MVLYYVSTRKLKISSAIRFERTDFEAFVRHDVESNVLTVTSYLTLSCLPTLLPDTHTPASSAQPAEFLTYIYNDS